MIVIKRDGTKVPFDKTKIMNAIIKAFKAVDGEVSEYARIKAENIANYIEENGQKTLNVSMRGVPTVVYADGDYILNLSAEVTGKSLSVSFYQGLDVVSDLPIAIDVEDRYVYELKNELDSLPNKLIFPKGSVIKKDEGLLIYYDFDEVKWNFLKRL